MPTYLVLSRETEKGRPASELPTGEGSNTNSLWKLICVTANVQGTMSLDYPNFLPLSKKFLQPKDLVTSNPYSVIPPKCNSIRLRFIKIYFFSKRFPQINSKFAHFPWRYKTFSALDPACRGASENVPPPSLGVMPLAQYRSTLTPHSQGPCAAQLIPCRVRLF